MNEVPVVIFRSVLAFIFLLIYARILGKQQVAQLTFFEYVAGITIGSIASEMSVDLTSSVLPHAIGLTVWFLLPLSLQLVSAKSRLAGKVISGEPVIVIQNGKLLDKALRIARYRIDDLLEKLRSKGVFDISEVEFALLEANGDVSVLLKSQHRPVTPADLGLETKYEGLPTELVVDGEIQRQNLDNLGLSREWLMGELRRRGIGDARDVFYAALNTRGELYVDVYRDKLVKLQDASDYPGVQ